jgi:hypothetical protein
MMLHTAPPAGWDARIVMPLQSSGYAEASRALGCRPFYVESADGIALVLARRIPVPLLAGWTARAQIYAHARHARFVPALCERVRALGISQIKLGDSRWGWDGPVPDDWNVMRRVRYHVFVHDLDVDEAAVLAGARRVIRRHLKKYGGEVTVSEVRTAADVMDYIRLAIETGDRMRGRAVPAVFPRGYFETIFRTMVPRGQAALFIARAAGAPLAASTFVIGAGRCTQIHGCSTRDRALTPKQGPTLIFWHAMKYARARGCRTFDLGAVTPTEDVNHPHWSVYEYKRMWGGRLESFEGAEIVLSPLKHAFQERVLAPMWGRLHPLYLRFFAPGAPALTGAETVVVSGQEPRA